MIINEFTFMHNFRLGLRRSLKILEKSKHLENENTRGEATGIRTRIIITMNDLAISLYIFNRIADLKTCILKMFGNVKYHY